MTRQGFYIMGSWVAAIAVCYSEAKQIYGNAYKTLSKILTSALFALKVVSMGPSEGRADFDFGLMSLTREVT